MIQIETVIYSSPSGKDLKMDILKDSEAVHQEQPCPVVISIPNGNFLNGKRDEATYQYTCRYFAEKGYMSVCIDYRQGLHGAAFLPHTIVQAVRMGVEDLAAATRYILEHAEQLHADPARISLLGNGAGACIALTAEYELVNHRLKDLPTDFNYACVIAHSGALATDETAFAWEGRPCPIVLVQGMPAGDIPSSRFFVPGLLWVGGNALRYELTKTGCRNIYYDVSSFEHLSHKDGQMDKENVNEYLDQFVFRDIEMLTR